jgi:hypothetical protein
MVDSIKRRYAEDIEVGDELDLDGDEYGDNEDAIFGYAVVNCRTDSYVGRDPWVELETSQGIFRTPAGHKLKVKVPE